MKTVCSVLAVAIAVLLAAGASTTWAGGGCGDPGYRDAGCCDDTACDVGLRCGRCGGPGACKMCRLVCTEKKISVTCYSVDCKAICVPSCGSGCTRTECVTCKQGGSCCNPAGIAKVAYATGKPGCAKPKCVKKLVKYKMTKKVPAYEWKMVCLCPSCANACGDGRASGGCEGESCATTFPFDRSQPNEQAYTAPPLPPRQTP